MSTGPQGPQGLTGATGPTGPTGLQGPTGAIGIASAPTSDDIVFVSDTHGDDGSGAVGNMGTPFKTVDAAVAALPADGIVCIWWSSVVYTLNVAPTNVITYVGFGGQSQLNIVATQVTEFKLKDLYITSLPSTVGLGVTIERCIIDATSITTFGINIVFIKSIFNTFETSFSYLEDMNAVVKNCIFNIQIQSIGGTVIIHNYDDSSTGMKYFTNNFYNYLGVGNVTILVHNENQVTPRVVSEGEVHRVSGPSNVTLTNSVAPSIISNSSILNNGTVQSAYVPKPGTTAMGNNMNDQKDIVTHPIGNFNVYGSQTTRYGVFASSGLSNNAVAATGVTYDAAPVDDTIVLPTGSTTTTVNLYDDNKVLGKRTRILNYSLNPVDIVASGTTTIAGNSGIILPINSSIELVYHNDKFNVIHSTILPLITGIDVFTPTEPNPWSGG